MFKRLLSGLALTVLVAAQASADSASQWRLSSGQTLSLSYRDTQNVLLSMAQTSQVLVTGNDSYLITRQGGSAVAMNMNDMGEALNAFSRLMLPGAQHMARFEGATVKFNKTGRQEIVAGYRGEVYQMVIQTRAGVEQHELVVSDHPDAVAVQAIFLALGQRAAKVMPSNALFETMNYFSRQAQQAGLGGVLRYGRDMVLEKLEKQRLPDATFRLPDGVTLVRLPTYR